MKSINPSSAIATIIADREVSYSLFCLGISEVARRLRQLELDRTVPVALIMERGPELYASQLGVLATGGFFLPIDPANPELRIKFLLKDSCAKCVIVDAPSADQIRNLGLDIHVVELDTESVFDDAADPEQAQPIVFPHGADDPAYMIYTSGSTGQPKGVCIHWEAICNHNKGLIDVYQITSADRILQMISIGFDLSVEVIFTTIRAGACLVTIAPEALDSPVRFLKWVREQELTLLNMPTALWHSLVPALESEPLPECVRLVTIGGEQIKLELVDQWFRHISPDNVRLVHGYGPTETTITTTVCDLTPENREAIGCAIDNMECHIISADNQLIQASGQPGELYISGVSVAKGYWNRPEQTAAAFMHSELLGGKWCYRTGDKVMWDDQRQLLFCGRIDSQVKFRGYRIELHEIENTICLHPEITNAVVQKSDAGREQLVCFAIPRQVDLATIQNKEQQTELQQRITEFAKKTLPDYMVPTQFVFLDELPNTVGGKVDTRKLLSLVEANQESQPEISIDSLDEIQSIIADAWKSVLGAAPATLDTTFEDNGGDSLAGMALALKLEKSFPHKTFGAATLLSCPTINKLADYIRKTPDCVANEEDQELFPVINLLGQPIEGEGPILVFLHPVGGSGYLYSQLIDETIKNKYTIVILDSPWLTGNMPGAEHPYSAVSIAKRYADVLAQRLPKGRKIVTAGYSFGGILAIETARSLSEHGFDVAKVINIDQPVPEALNKATPIARLVNWLHRLKAPLLTWQEMYYAKEKEHTQAGKKTRFSDNSEMQRSFELEEILSEIENSYQPQPCDLELHLIRADVFQAKYDLKNDYGWSKYARHLLVHRVSGSHFTIFQGRYLRKLSAKFQQLV